MSKEEILKLYTSNIPLFNKIKKDFDLNIQELLKRRGIKHLYQSRIKDKHRFKEKINRKKYANFDQINDIFGARIIVYSLDEILKVHLLIKENYEISYYDSIDKRIPSAVVFGYKSLHLIVKGSEGLLFEIQVRTFLQHTWAEIEHSIGYKNNFGTSYEVKRKFSRISSFLEQCDIEFSQIKQSIDDCNIDIEIEKLLMKDDDFNEKNLCIYLQTSKVVSFIDKEISNHYGYSEKIDDMVTLNDEINRLKYFGINDFQKISEQLILHKDKILTMAHKLINIPKGITPRGICLFYLAYVLVSKKELPEIYKYLDKYTYINNKDFISKKIYEFNDIS